MVHRLVTDRQTDRQTYTDHTLRHVPRCDEKSGCFVTFTKKLLK